MDVMRIDSDDEERRFCVCVASYGYMGDLMRQSEKLRFMGPSRYNIAGAATLFKNRVRASIQPCSPACELLRVLFENASSSVCADDCGGINGSGLRG